MKQYIYALRFTFYAMYTLVIGGSGFLGAAIARAVIACGDTVCVLRRASSSLLALDGLPVENVVGNLLDVDAVAG